MKLINDKNFTQMDYEAALEYLYGISRHLEGAKLGDCLADIQEIEDILSAESIHAEYTKRKNSRNKRTRQRKEYHKKKKLYDDIGQRWASPVYQHDDGSLRYCSYAENTKRYYKRYSNKKLRRESNRMLRTFGTYDVPKGNKYRRIFDYAWEID